MDGYGMVRNMIATNRSNLSRVGQRRTHKFESFDTSLFEPDFPVLNSVVAQPLSEEFKKSIEQQQLAINKNLRKKDLIAGFVAFLMTSLLMGLFFGYIF